jgi:hypothetical protein
LLAPHNKIKAHVRYGKKGMIGRPNEKDGPARSTASDAIAILSNKWNKDGDQGNRNEHPVLAVDAKKGKMLDQKMQRFLSPIF